MGFHLVEYFKEYKYLWIPIYLKSHSLQLWDDVITKFKMKFTIWVARWLNLARYNVLIKEVISSLPLYQFTALLAQ